MYRSIIASAAPRRAIVASRSLHASPAAFKSLTDKVKETAHNVNLKVGQTLAAGIEKGEETTDTVKKTAGATTERASHEASQASQTASHKAGKAAQGAKEAKEDFKRNVKE